MRVIGLMFVVGAIVIAACSGGSAGEKPTPSAAPTEPSTQTLRGTMVLKEGAQPGGVGSVIAIGAPCWGIGGYDDMAAGTQVTVRNENDALIAKGALSEGAISPRGPTGTLPDCDFAFTVRDVPNAAFYTIEVSHRGELTYSREEMEALDWEVAFTLGD